jgi:hypothetical protein
MKLKRRPRESVHSPQNWELFKDQINNSSNSLLRLLQSLQADKLIIPPTFLKQRGMVPGFDHTASFKNVDYVGVLDCAQAVGDDDCGAAFGYRV